MIAIIPISIKVTFPSLTARGKYQDRNRNEPIIKNGFIILRYELGDSWIEYSYNSELNKKTLDAFMEADRTKWLKDLAQDLLQTEETEQELENFTG